MSVFLNQQQQIMEELIKEKLEEFRIPKDEIIEGFVQKDTFVQNLMQNSDYPEKYIDLAINQLQAEGKIEMKEFGSGGFVGFQIKQTYIREITQKVES